MPVFTHKEFQLEYKKEGDKEPVLICFHGFGQNMNAWDSFLPVLKKRFRVYSFSFFHHGTSVYPSERIITNTLQPKELAEIFETFLKNENISRFSLLGYSMGAKISFELTQFFGERIDNLILFAPDGIYRNYWYTFTSKNKVGNLLYRRILKDPSNLFSVMKTLRHFRLLNDKLYRFVIGNLDTKEKRQLVYNVLMSLREIDPSAKRSAEIILKNNIKCILIFGKYDKVITLSTGEKFNKLINNKGILMVADCGHNLLIARNADLLESILDHSLK